MNLILIFAPLVNAVVIIPENTRVVVVLVVIEGDIKVNAPLFTEYVYDGDEPKLIYDGNTIDIVEPDFIGRIIV